MRKQNGGRRNSARAPIAKWWVRLARREVDAWFDRTSLAWGELCRLLARAAGRDAPFSRTALYRFFESDEPATDVAFALMVTFDLPGFAFYPDDEIEARAYQVERAKAIERRARRREAISASIDEMAGVGAAARDGVLSPGAATTAAAARGRKQDQQGRLARVGSRGRASRGPRR